MRIATDIGGTFTDLVYLDEKTGGIGTTKVSSTPVNYSDGVVNTVVKAKLNAVETKFFVHGATVVINILTERKGVKTGLITTKGFRDVIEISRCNRPDLYNFYYTKPKSFVPRYLRFEVSERVNFKGEELTTLNEDDVIKAVEQLKAQGVEAIAVCFLHSYANPDHEIKCGEIIKSLAPDIPVTLSSQLTKEWHEYERTTTTVLNSYVLPIAKKYLDTLEEHLEEMGMDRKALHVMQSNGGSATFNAGKVAPINLVESGPVAGIIGSVFLGKVIGEPNVIGLDIGGTTAKTSLVENYTPRVTTEYRIEQRRDYAGYPILSPTIDIVEIGAGGGSIAWIDKAGAMRVGPVSAGSDPGPACYPKGGDQPTVTDANVVAGRINPDYFLGSEIPLNVNKARIAIEPIAKNFGISVEQAAMGIIRIADASMISALKLISVRRGYDPRDFVLIAFGGGGAMHAAALMRELKVKKVIIPTNPAVFSAWGMLMTDLRQDYIRTLITRTDLVEPEALDSIYQELEVQARDDLRSENIEENNMVFQRFADMRYKGQEHTVKIALPAGKITKDLIPEINAKFHALHEQAYAFRLNAPIELVNYHLTGIGLVQKLEFQKIDGHNGSVEQALKGVRRVNFDELGFFDANIYERDNLPIGVSVLGPAIVEEPTSTTVVFPEQKITKDDYGFLHIESVM
jgi:N-methylhydantoinase A